jgi:hypothetical protein
MIRGRHEQQVHAGQVGAQRVLVAFQENHVDVVVRPGRPAGREVNGPAAADPPGDCER